jgi:dihydrofolate reductase
MRKLKLQMNTTIDGFVARPNGELDWMKLDDWDDEENNCVNELIDSSDIILMGRKMTDGFVNYWTKAVENPKSPKYEFAKKMVDTPKVVFTKTLGESPWANTVLAKGDLVEEVNRLKNQTGKDILVYGGADFVSSLIKENLIDEYNFFIIPTAIGRGMTLFGKLEDKTLSLKLNRSQSYNCGIVFNTYLK